MVLQVIHRELSEFPLREFQNCYRAEDFEIHTSGKTPQSKDFGSTACPEHLIKVLFTNYAKKVTI